VHASLAPQVWHASEHCAEGASFSTVSRRRECMCRMRQPLALQACQQAQPCASISARFSVGCARPPLGLLCQHLRLELSRAGALPFVRPWCCYAMRVALLHMSFGTCSPLTYLSHCGARLSNAPAESAVPTTARFVYWGDAVPQRSLPWYSLTFCAPATGLCNHLEELYTIEPSACPFDMSRWQRNGHNKSH
jgi:hypothetical protein